MAAHSLAQYYSLVTIDVHLSANDTTTKTTRKKKRTTKEKSKSNVSYVNDNLCVQIVLIFFFLFLIKLFIKGNDSSFYCVFVPVAFSDSFSVLCRAVWNSILVALLAVYCFAVSSLLLRYWLYEVELTMRTMAMRSLLMVC